MQPAYEFTKDWFSWAPDVWKQLIPLLPARNRFLEIGSYEGRSAAWIVENMMDEKGGHVDCVDTWGGGEEHTTDDMRGTEERFSQNMQLAIRNTRHTYFKIKKTSTDALAQLIYDRVPPYDFIYIDGAHTADQVLQDACMAWPLLKVDGIMVFDDYLWGSPRDVLHRPKLAIDSFTNIMAERASLVHVGYQAALQKRG